jgi:hypothetical protein
MTKNIEIGFDGDADTLGPGVFGIWLGAANAKIGNKFVLTRTRKMRKAV